MKQRKTIEVSAVLSMANNMLANSTHAVSAESRMAVASMLERILMDTGNYHGFNYIGGYVAGMDESRRFYYSS